MNIQNLVSNYAKSFLHYHSNSIIKMNTFLEKTIKKLVSKILND